MAAYGYDEPLSTCYGRPSSGWRTTRSNATWRTIWGACRLQEGRVKKLQNNINSPEILTVVDRGLGDITHGSGFHDVPDDELLDRLVLRDTTGAVGATHGLYVATVVLAASSITAFLRLKNSKKFVGQHFGHMQDLCEEEILVF